MGNRTMIRGMFSDYRNCITTEGLIIPSLIPPKHYCTLNTVWNVVHVGKQKYIFF